MPPTPSPHFAIVAQRQLMMLEINAEGVIRFASETLAEVLGFDPRELVDRRLLEIAKPKNATDVALLTAPVQLPDGAKTHKLECHITCSSGVARLFDIHAMALDDAKSHFGLIFHDISDWKRKETLLIERIDRLRETIEAKDVELDDACQTTALELTKKILHEASQPLTAIQCYGGIAQELLEEKGSVKANKVHVFVQTMIRSSELTANILRRFHDSTSGQSAVITVEDVGKLVNGVTELLAFPLENRGIKLKTRIDAGEARLDRTQIQQVLLNLVRNSIEALPIGTGKIEICALRKPLFWEFTVLDNGPGVEEDQIAHLFVPAESKKQDGAGLGLSLAQAIIQCHGGQIRYSSVQPTGARFQFELPFDKPPTRSQGSASSSLPRN